MGDRQMISNLVSADISRVWSALGELQHHFSQLSDSEIALFVGCTLAQRYSAHFDASEYLHPAFIEAATPALGKVQSDIAAISADGEELAELIRQFITYVESKIKPKDRSRRWARFSEWASNLVNQDLNQDGST